jgi:HAE1 family hydrophobic/amphiphilic exporter-1
VVELSYEEPKYFVRANGQNVVQIAVEKRSGANTVTVSRTIRAALPEVQENIPFPADFHIDDDQGEDLRERLVELVYRSLAILGVLFILLALTLRQIRLTSIVVASIVFAIVISLSLFYFLRLSVNFITISGLTVCFGLILDNSILVLDAIHRRLVALERAEKAQLSRRAKFEVAVEVIATGTRDVTFPIVATTLTTMVAFLAFIFLSGRLALFYVPLAVSVATAMTASLFVAFGWIPVALNQSWAAPLVRKSPDGPNEVTDKKLDHSPGHCCSVDLDGVRIQGQGLEGWFLASSRPGGTPSLPGDAVGYRHPAGDRNLDQVRRSAPSHPGGSAHVRRHLWGEPRDHPGQLRR